VKLQGYLKRTLLDSRLNKQEKIVKTLRLKKKPVGRLSQFENPIPTMAMMDDEDSKSDLSSLLEVNRLDYRLPPSLSIATSRSMKTFRSSKHEHEMGETQVDFQLSSGAAYVDLLNSYLSFEVKFQGTAGELQDIEMPAHAGFLQMISGYRVIHSSGVELDRMNTACGEWTQLQNYYNRSTGTRRTAGTLYNMNDSINPQSIYKQEDMGVYEVNKQNLKANYTDQVPAEHKDWVPNVIDPEDLATDPTKTTFRVVIPLQHLAGIFDQDLLAPSFLTAGLRIELEFYPKEHFFIKHLGWPAGTAVFITKPEINLECFQLTDSVVRKLSQISASSGLEWYWDAVHNMTTTKGDSEITVQVTRALSRANCMIVKSRHDSAVNRHDQDSFASQPWVHHVWEDEAKYPKAIEYGNSGNLIGFQVQLGAQFIPSQPIQYREDFLHSAMKTFSQFRRNDEVGSVEMPSFAGIKMNKGTAQVDGPPVVPAVIAKYKPGLAIAAVPLESSSTLQQSGSAISAQRTAVCNLAFKYPVDQLTMYDGSTSINGKLRRVDVFVPYSKLATLFLDSVVVRS